MLLCFLVASTVWLLNALNKTYNNVRISYPIAFVYEKKKVIPVLPPPKEVVINVTGKGWKLLRRSLNLRIRPARIEIRNLTTATFLTGPYLRPALNAALDGLVLNYVVTDTVYFNFEPLISRTVLLQLPASQIPVGPGYAVSGKPEIVPRSITVTGPVSLINALPDPLPVHIPDSNLTKDYSVQLPVSFLNTELIKANVKDIMVTVGIKALKERQIKVPVLLPEKLAKARFIMQPDSAVLKYTFHPDSSAFIKTDSFAVQAVLEPGKIIDTMATLKLIRRPKGVKKVTLSPKRATILQR